MRSSRLNCFQLSWVLREQQELQPEIKQWLCQRGCCCRVANLTRRTGLQFFSHKQMSKSPLLGEFSWLHLFPLLVFTPDAHHSSLISPQGFSAQTGQCWMSPVFAAGLYRSCGQTCSSSDFRNSIFFFFFQCGQKQWRRDIWSRRWRHSAPCLSMFTVWTFPVFLLVLPANRTSGTLLMQSQGGAQRRWADDTGCWWHHFLFISTTLRSSGLLHPCVIGGFWQEAAEKIGTCTFGAKLRPPVVNIFMHLSSRCAL